MPAFEFYVDDARYSVPTLVILTIEDEAAARVRAEQFLTESSHHRGVEVCEHGARLFGLGTYAQTKRRFSEGEANSD